MARPFLSDHEIPHRSGEACVQKMLGCYAPAADLPPDDPLEAARVREALAERTRSVYGAERAVTLTLLADHKAVAERLALADAVARESDAGRALPRLELPEIRPALERARVENAVLSTEELTAIYQFLVAASELEAAAGLAEDAFLAGFLGGVPQPVELSRHLERTIDPTTGEIRDEASEELAAARSEARRLREQVRSHLEERAVSPGLRSHLRDSRITLRQGRYVLAVKATSQGQLKGVVHATSGSGETVFMEPLEAVSLNNRLERAEGKVQRAEYQLRWQASRVVARAQNELDAMIERLGLVDLLGAGETLRRDIGGSVPELGEGPDLRLENAVHPLLALEHGPGTAVPNTVALGGESHCLVISGPNTGGKTVLLKAIGLAHWMAYCGLPIAGEGRVGWFRDLWALIGDQQSLSADLSTFSAQVVRLKGLLTGLDNDRLVLIDELGSGTNPNEGSALGIALLERLRKVQAVALVSTHLDRLKHYAVAHEGVVNAALSFDVERLEPTYRLEWAQAGRSQALEVAAQLGLPQDLLDAAWEALGEETVEVEQLLNERDRLLAEADNERAAAARARERAEAAEAEAANLRAQVAAERERAYQEALEHWQEVLRSAREEVRTVIQRLKETGNTAEADQALAELDAGFRSKAPMEPPKEVPVQEDRDARVGDHGRLAPFRQVGTVVAIDPERGKVQVDLGGKRVWGGLQDFQRTQRAETEPDDCSFSQASRGMSPQSVGTQIDLRGQRRDEALTTLQQFLDNTYIVGLGRVTVLHGKGAGVLAQAVQEALQRDPRVAEFGSARPEAGGTGVTQVVFKGVDSGKEGS